MNQNAPPPSFELPQLPNDKPTTPESGVESHVSPMETLAQPMAPPLQQSMPPSVSRPSQSVVPVSMPPIPASGPADPTVPTIAEDAELIEKEWVVKAKQIVAATKEDPYMQTREINKFKAEYLRKRYGKDLKVEES